VADEHPQPGEHTGRDLRVRLPSYHAWLTRDADGRSRDLQAWVQPMMQFHAASRSS